MSLETGRFRRPGPIDCVGVLVERKFPEGDRHGIAVIIFDLS